MTVGARVPAKLVPQIASLADVRAATEAVSQGATTAQEIASRTGLHPRRAGYAIKAAMALGWLDGKILTPSGQAVLGLSPGSTELRAAVRRGLEEGPLRPLSAVLLGEPSPGSQALAELIQRLTGLGPNTAKSRAGALLAWRGELVAATTPRSARRPRSVAPQLVIPGVTLSDALIRDLHRDNPWWTGGDAKPQPPMRRSFVSTIHRQLGMRLAPIIVVRGPRQVGKTTAQMQVIEELLERGVSGRRILRVQFDELASLTRMEEPILRITDWFQASVLGCSFNTAAKRDEPAFVFLDEVQNLAEWSVQLKHLVDGSQLQSVVTGSSALRIEAGRDSLSGRIHTIEIGTLSLHEIATIRGLGQLPTALPDNGLEPLGQRDFWRELRALGMEHQALRDTTFAAFSERGGYPLVHQRADVAWSELAAQLNESVIRRVIQHDLRVGDRGRKRDPALLEELFRLACRYAGQSPGPELFAREARRALASDVGTQKIRKYLEFLDRALLVRLVQPLELRLKKKHGYPKLCLADHGLRKSWLQEDAPLDPNALAGAPDLSMLAGHIAESVAGGYLSTLSGVELAHLPARGGEPEVDFVITTGAYRIPIEVKYRRRIDAHADTEGLRSFVERAANRAPFGVLVTQTDGVDVPDPRVVSLPLSSVLMIR